jgi:hypothetical protein
VASDTDTKSTSTEIAKRPPVEALGVEMGVDNSLPFTTPFTPVAVQTRGRVQHDLNEVMREDGDELGPSVAQLVTMRRMDGQAQALYRLLVLPLRAALENSEFIADDDGEKEAEFITDVFRAPPNQGGMSVTFERFMSQLLTALFDGFSAFEKVFWIPPKGPLEGKIVLKKLAYRPSDTVTFVADKQGGYAGFRQRTHVGGRTVDVFIDPEYSFYYAANEEQRKFYGVSFFQSAYYHYDKKIKLYFTAHMAAQRAAVGTRIGTVPGNASPAAKTEFRQALNNLIFAQSIMVPEGFEVDVQNEASNFDFLAMVNHHNNQMSKSILAGFFDKETGAGQSEGSLVNFAQPGDDMFMLMLRTIMGEIASQINNYIIPQLIDYNFATGKYPKFTWGKLTDEQKAAISATFDKLASAQTVTPEFIRALEQHQADEFGIDVDWDAVEAREAEEKAAELAMNGPVGPDGQPIMPGTDPAGASIPQGAEEQVTDLSDVVALLAARADMEAGVAEANTRAASGPPVPPGKKPGARPGSAIQPRSPQAPARAPGANDPNKRKKSGSTIGLTDEMIDWADHMVYLSAGEDFRDG